MIPFRYFIRVRYYECDAQKIVFNARYGDYIDIASTEFMRALGFGATMINGPLDYQLVKQTIEWKSSARFDDVLEIRVSTAHIGTTSFTLRMEFRIADTEPIIAVGETVYVCMDAATLTKTPINDKLRAALTIGAPGLITDHAGFRNTGVPSPSA